MEPIDRAILVRVQRGERSAYTALFDRYYARVEGFARSQVQNPENARDIASETFLRAYRNVDRFRLDEEITYLGYLLMICRRLIYTQHARDQIACTKPLDEADEMEPMVDDYPSPEQSVLDAEQSEVIREALASLPASDREIIFLAYTRDLSRRDIMHVLNKPSVTSVTSHLYRAMQRLKAAVVSGAYFASDRAEKERG